MMDIVVTQQLGTEAMNYAASAVGTPDDPSPLNAIEVTRQIVADSDGAPLVSSTMADALRDLQMAALAFTVKTALYYYRADLDDLDQLGEKLFERLKQRGAVRMSLVPGVVSAAQNLGARSLDYAREIVSAQDNGAPVGSEAVQRALSNLQLAAIAFTTQLAMADGYERKRLRRIEKKLVAVFAHKENGW